MSTILSPFFVVITKFPVPPTFWGFITPYTLTIIVLFGYLSPITIDNKVSVIIVFGEEIVSFAFPSSNIKISGYFSSIPSPETY